MGSPCNHFILWRSLDSVGSSMVSVIGLLSFFSPSQREWGESLQPVAAGSCSVDRLHPGSFSCSHTVDAGSLANKTFILNYFFISCRLDYLLLTETWMTSSVSSAFCELLPLELYVLQLSEDDRSWRVHCGDKCLCADHLNNILFQL